MWNTCRIKETSQDPYIWFNELYYLNLNFKKIKEKYQKEEDEMKEHVSDVLPEQYKPIRVSCNVNKKFVGSGKQVYTEARNKKSKILKINFQK